LRIDGGDNQIIGQTGLDQLDDGVIIHRLLGNEQGADCQKYKCENVLAHESSPYDSKPLKLFEDGTRIINLNPAFRKRFLFSALNAATGPLIREIYTVVLA
jgi:hypothetical protein